MHRILTSAILTGAAMMVAQFAHASTVIGSACVNVANPAGCAFSGNINGNHNASNVNSYLYAQNQYNAFNDTNASANPDISLNYLGDTKDGFPGTFTGAGTSSGTWTLSGYLLDFLAVKTGDNFVLYQLGMPASTGSWTTNGFLDGKDLSHLVFFGEKSTPAVPEPATWAMVLAGFGAMGVAMRRRRNVAVSFG